MRIPPFRRDEVSQKMCSALHRGRYVHRREPPPSIGIPLATFRPQTYYITLAGICQFRGYMYPLTPNEIPSIVEFVCFCSYFVVKSQIERFYTLDFYFKERFIMQDNRTYTLGEWLMEWWEIYKVPTVKPQTAQRDRETIQLISSCATAQKPLDEISERMVQLILNEIQQREYHPGKRYSKSCLKKVKGVLSQAMKAAKKEHHIDTNPCDDAKIPEAPTKEVLPFTHFQEEQIRKACNADPQGHLLIFLLCTGLRQSELCGLRWEDYDPEKGMIYIRKSKTPAGVRWVYLISEAKEILLAQSHIDEFIFHNICGRPISKSSLRHLCERISEQSGIHVTCHACRHTFVTRLCEEKGEAKAIAQIIGHAQAGYVLDIYAKMEQHELRRTIFLLDHRVTDPSCRPM